MFSHCQAKVVWKVSEIFRGLLKRASPEAQMVANIVGRIARSTTGSNLRRINIETGLDSWTSPHWKIQSQVSKSSIQQEDEFETHYLKKLLKTRLELKASAKDTGQIDALNG